MGAVLSDILFKNYDALGHFDAFVSGVSYQQRQETLRAEYEFKFFATYDLNDDGVVSREEYRTANGWNN